MPEVHRPGLSTNVDNMSAKTAIGTNDEPPRGVLAELRRLVGERAQLERREAVLVRRARNEGFVWEQIAMSLDVSLPGRTQEARRWAAAEAIARWFTSMQNSCAYDGSFTNRLRESVRCVQARSAIPRHPHHRRRARRLPGRARALPADREPGMPLGEPGDHRAAPARAGGRRVDGHRRAHPRPAQLAVRPGPGWPRPGAGDRTAPGGVRATPAGLHRGITVPAIVDVPSGAVVTNDFAQITLDLLDRVAGVPPAGGAGAVPRGAPRRDRRGEPVSCSPTSTTACTDAGSPALRRPTTRPTRGCSAGSTGSPND